MDEQEFKTRADESISRLYRKLATASDTYEFEPDFAHGALTIEFEEPKAKFVVSPNAPVRQLWISAHSRSFKLDWNAGKSEFVLAATGQTLTEFMAEAISTQLGEPVQLG